MSHTSAFPVIMSIKRIVPDITSDRMEESRAFYTECLGLNLAMDMGWIMTFVSPSQPLAQVTVMQAPPPEAAVPNPQVSIEVEDVDAAHDRAVAQEAKIVYPLTDEPWGVRRFFVEDPNGVVINVMCHLA